VRVERDPEDRLGGGEGYIGHPDDTAGFENVVRLEDVGVEHQRVGLATSASVRARDKERRWLTALPGAGMAARWMIASIPR